MRKFRERMALSGLARDTQGVAAVEFALVAPVFLLLLLGAFNMGQMVYGKSLLAGAIDKAARANALESANTSTTDAMVKTTVKRILPDAVITTQRVSYYDFNDIGRPEKWNDSNANGTCDNSEAYTDENQNGRWDADVGSDGNGGANDVVLYKVKAEYTPAFVLPFAPQSWKKTTISASTVRKNQPFALQKRYATTAGVCS